MYEYGASLGCTPNMFGQEGSESFWERDPVFVRGDDGRKDGQGAGQSLMPGPDNGQSAVDCEDRSRSKMKKDEKTYLKWVTE